MNIKKIQRVLAPILRPLAYPYAYVTRTRRQRYLAGRNRSYRPKGTTISVGNIAAGGTGKTPLTGWILDWAERHRRTAVVLTRGYGGKTGTYPVVVTPHTSASQCGDEPLLLARSYPSATIIAFPKRHVSMALAEKFFVPDLVVLDDGMQHLAIQRDMDFIVLKENDLRDGWNKVIPAGEWREDMSALTVADAFFIKATAEQFSELCPLLIERLAKFEKPVFSFALEVVGLQRMRSVLSDSRAESTTLITVGTTPPLDVEPSATSCALPTFVAPCDFSTFGEYVLVTGVGEPGQVVETAVGCIGRVPAKVYHFGDHHAYSARDMQQIQSHGLPVICTEKDAVKLEQFSFSVPFYSLDVSVVFGERLLSALPFEEWLDAQYRELSKVGSEKL